MKFLNKIVNHLNHKTYMPKNAEKNRKLLLAAIERKEILEKKLIEMHKNSSNVTLDDFEKVQSEIEIEIAQISEIGFEFGVGKEYEYQLSKGIVSEPKHNLRD